MIYTQTIAWEEFSAQLDRVLQEMSPESFDAIVAVAQGGIVPAALIQQGLGVPLSVVRINYRDSENRPRYDDARLLEEAPFPLRGQRVLLVDDVSRTGKTLARARAWLNGNTVKTLLVNGAADYRLFDTPECLRMPWKRD